MDNIVVITQNVKLESLHLLRNHLKGEETLVFSTQLVFENEAAIISEQLGTKCIFVNFTDLMTDADFERCDVDAYTKGLRDVSQYYAQIKQLKNQKVVERLLAKYPSDNRLLVCDDLGLDEDTWLKKGFKKVACEYYHLLETNTTVRKRGVVGLIKSVLNQCERFYTGDIYVASDGEKKHLFFGSLNRIGYRFNIDFKKASKWENIKYIIGYFWCKALKTYPKNDTVRMSTLHESTAWPLPHHPNWNVKIIQDDGVMAKPLTHATYSFGQCRSWDKS